ncbi:hypothetical protein Glove_33g67 [Diversispora epigaea]|uniref:Uncharacterized protein n=1 Tax=Diversispora epigaea TaxID=1348612 RepID=A0A397JJ56_9GLOM|nr:hypothetical protein Glove_33g67 [Diversispora epigaea]
MVKKLQVSNNSTNPVFEEIDDNDKALKQCMKEITLKLSDLETMQSNANEVTRCVFITTHRWQLFEDPMKKKFT